MLIWLIFLFFVCFSVHSQRFILPAFFSIVTCLPYYVRLGPISLFAGICLFIYCYGVVSKYRIETFFVNKWIKCKHSKKCTFYTLRFGCSFAAVNTIKPQLL